MEFCEICQKQMKKGNMRFHIKSKMHLDRIAKKENTQTESVEQETTEENETEDNESNQFFNQTPRNSPTNKDEE